MKLSRADAQAMQTSTKSYQLLLITDCQMDVGRMPFGSRATEGISVLDSCVSGLNTLLREGEIAARDCVQVRVLNLHDKAPVG